MYGNALERDFAHSLVWFAGAPIVGSWHHVRVHVAAGVLVGGATASAVVLVPGPAPT